MLFLNWLQKSNKDSMSVHHTWVGKVIGNDAGETGLTTSRRILCIILLSLHILLSVVGTISGFSTSGNSLSTALQNPSVFNV